MPRGGARPGAGRPKGSKDARTLEKEEARRLLRARVTSEMTSLVDAQITHAKGIKYLVVREKKSGKFVRVTEAMARVKLGDDEEVIEVWEKDPSVQAFTDLMNRTIDKPPEQVEVAGHDGGPLIIQWKS
jgi:hypothetical protein